LPPRNSGYEYRQSNPHGQWGIEREEAFEICEIRKISQFFDEMRVRDSRCLQSEERSDLSDMSLGFGLDDAFRFRMGYPRDHQDEMNTPFVSKPRRFLVISYELSAVTYELLFAISFFLPFALRFTFCLANLCFELSALSYELFIASPLLRLPASSPPTFSLPIGLRLVPFAFLLSVSPLLRSSISPSSFFLPHALCPQPATRNPEQVIRISSPYIPFK
jgi:hypothetical protein